jgi:CheY-like chemotaxis protein
MSRNTHDSRPVLVIEDDADIRFGITVILEDEGYAVATAANGREALAYLRSAAGKPCLILLDLMMPGMNGWEFRAEQRRDPSLAGIPVLVVSAAADLAARAAPLGATAVIQKPINVADLLDVVQRCCGPSPHAGKDR